ncbi:MAG TPA: VOC family protein [Vicinamibacterales bacterium]|nr:VOC family protein [Vicinamibacterales bacterium]
MAEQNSVNWFEIPVTDLGRAKAFYEQVFGVSLAPMDMGPASMAMFPMTPGAPHAAGCLIKTDGYTPSHAGTVVYFAVADIEGTLAKASSNGGSTVVPKMSIGEHGFIGQLQDTEGNRVGLHSMQ